MAPVDGKSTVQTKQCIGRRPLRRGCSKCAYSRELRLGLWRMRIVSSGRALVENSLACRRRIIRCMGSGWCCETVLRRTSSWKIWINTRSPVTRSGQVEVVGRAAIQMMILQAMATVFLHLPRRRHLPCPCRRPPSSLMVGTTRMTRTIATTATAIPRSLSCEIPPTGPPKLPTPRTHHCENHAVP